MNLRDHQAALRAVGVRRAAIKATYQIGDHVIVPLELCACGGALGIAPAKVVGFWPSRGLLTCEVDLSGCSTPRACSFDERLCFSVAEIEDLRWLL